MFFYWRKTRVIVYCNNVCVKTLRKHWQQSLKRIERKLEKLNKNKNTTCIETDFIGHRGVRDQASAALPYLVHSQHFPSKLYVFRITWRTYKPSRTVQKC